MQRKLRNRLDSLDPKLLLMRLLPWLFLILLYLTAASMSEIAGSTVKSGMD